MSRLGRALAPAAAVLAAAVLVAAPAVAGIGVPPGYAPVAKRILGRGLEHVTLTSPRAAQSVHVARIAPDAPFVLRAVAANDDVVPGGDLERTSSICRRVSCLVAVNGDFWAPDSRLPIGGVVSDGQLLRSPSALHNQLMLSAKGLLSAGTLRWKGTLVPTDLRSLSVTGLNVRGIENQIVLYTPAFGRSTLTSARASELVLRIVRPAGAVRLGATSVVRAVAFRSGAGNAAIPADGVVLSGHGKAAKSLAGLWSRIRTGSVSATSLLRLESAPGAIESIGGSPVLVRDGQPVVPTDRTSFVTGRHPRTMVGRTARGESLLVTVDGRQPGQSVGMSLAEAAALMIDLGAVDAINLDGGGSTTFVDRGNVANRPSDRVVRRGGAAQIVPLSSVGEATFGHVERPVAVALAVVPRTPTPKTQHKKLLDGFEVPQTVALPVVAGRDPASDPTGSLPALVSEPVAGSDNYLRYVAGLIFALALYGAVGLHLSGRRSRVRRSP